MFEYKFQLEQHTPIIQFELDQPEAVLRASEVKPAFDRYLAIRLQGNQIPEEWLVPGESAQATGSSFDYRMTIRPIDEVFTMPIHSPKKLNRWDEVAQAGFPGFFALLGDDEPKHVFRWTESVEVSIKTLHKGLLEFILVEFPKFLWGSNFGMRKTKGFGSFTVAKSMTPSGTLPGFEGDFETFSFNFSCASDLPNTNSVWGNIGEKAMEGKKKIKVLRLFVSWYELFSTVNDLHQIMRSGRMQGGIPALTARFAKKHEYRTEKEVLKNAMNAATRREPTEKDRALRELFGLSNDQAWKQQSAKVTVQATRKDINRFPSPIQYKPITISDKDGLVGFKVHVITKLIQPQILNEEIQYSSKNFGRPVKVNTPSYFSMQEFLDFVVDWANKSDEARELSVGKAKRLINILKNLKNT